MNRDIPKWLEDIQENSWELELLISGGAIFSLFHSSDYFNDTIGALIVINDIPDTWLYLILGSIGIQMLTLGFVLHLILRAIWLALVCINYAYPKGVKANKVKWRKPFKASVQQGDDLYDSILRTDHLCGLVMFMSIISTFLLGGIILVMFALLTIPDILFPYQSSDNLLFTYVFQPFLFFILIYILDLFLFGLLRKIPVLSYVVYPAFKLFDILSLRILFQRSLWVFSTNINKVRFSFFTGIFIIMAVMLSYGSFYRTLRLNNIFDSREFIEKMADNEPLYSMAYADELDGTKIRHAIIPSKIINAAHLEFFMLYQKKYDRYLTKSKRYKHLSEMTYVYIDDSLYSNLAWFPHFRFSSDQAGITTLIPIRHLKEGPHVLRLAIAADSVLYDNGVKPLLLPFWKED